MKQLLLCFWAYVSCQSVNSCAIQLKFPKREDAKQLLSFCQWGHGDDTSPTAAPSPLSEGFGGVNRPSATQPPGTTFPNDQLPLSWAVTTPLDKTSAGLVWLGTHSMSKIMSIRRSLSSLADQLLTKDPPTALLSVNSTTRC